MPLLEQLIKHEGFSAYPYLCPAGKTTIGYGFNIEAGITERLAKIILQEQIRETAETLKNKYSWWSSLSHVRQDVLINMAFNLGIHGLDKFKRMLYAISINNHPDVVKEMLSSKWASQVKERAQELATQWQEDKYQS